MIPPRLVRTVPASTSDQIEDWWEKACKLHPDWEHVTWRDPIDSTQFPLTAPHWARCTSGAQMAGLIRLEDIVQHGGIYIDSDVELYRSLDVLLSLRGFAAWEDPEVVPDAVLGCEPGHQGFAVCLSLAIARLHSASPDWRTGAGAWSTGPGVTTTVLPGRTDVLLFPPGAFYPYHYTEKDRRGEDHSAQPWTFAAHHWHGSWLPQP